MPDMPPGEPIIRVELLTAGYEDKAILENVSFEVRRGEVFIILGGSGCGKTTLLKHMIGLLPPLGGHVHIDDLKALGEAQAPVTIEYSAYSLSKGQKLGDSLMILTDLFARRLHR